MISPFYPILPNAQWIQKLIPLGVKTVQLRIKSDNQQIISQHIKEAKNICDKHQCLLIINDHWEEAIHQNCHFVHLGQTDLLNADIKLLKKKQIKIGVSTHSSEELENGLSINPDYIALGPIYPTTTKIMPWKSQGLNTIKHWKKIVPNKIPLIAIGGVTLENAHEIISAGANSVALISNITLAKNPTQQCQKWLQWLQSNSNDN